MELKDLDGLDNIGWYKEVNPQWNWKEQMSVPTILEKIQLILNGIERMIRQMVSKEMNGGLILNGIERSNRMYTQWS